MKVLVFNGWAAGAEAWRLCTFPHDWLFDYVEQLDGLPDQVMVDSDEVLLVGFSMGGSMALKTLLKYPEKVKGLVLVSATPRMMEERKSSVQGKGEEVVWRGMSERRLRALRLGTLMTFKDDSSPMYRVENLDRGLEYLQKTDIRDNLINYSRGLSPEKRLPVALFQSEKDGVVCSSNVEFLERIFPQATVTLVPGGEHVLPVMVPGLIDAAIYDIINELLD